jgi:tetratricopeptide (TPR) repeat protein
VKGLPWLLATCPEASVRRGTEAVERALEVCRRNECEDWNLLDTLAAAYAEVGDFEQAVKCQEHALARTNLSAEWRQQLEARLALYRAGMPYRELPKP